MSSLNVSGTTNLSGTLNINSNTINNYLFNNTGAYHSTYQDFNNIDKFGYTFIQANTNGPSVPSAVNQSYSWCIGLGSDYNLSSYAAQFAIPRNTAYLLMSVRFRENTSWLPWSGITASRVRFANDLWNSSEDGINRLTFASNGTSYYQAVGSTITSVLHDFRDNAGNSMMVIYNGGTIGMRVVGQITAGFYTIATTNRDLVGVNIENTQVNNYNQTTLYVIQGTFTGFHRCFTEDELFDKNEPQLFKDNYEGRIVISTGKIATDTNETNKKWEIKYDKDGITIEDALPQIELSRKKKDKRIFGVLGDKRRSNSRAERLIINSVGEGAIWVCNSNGNIENGDYITSSDYLGYGEKQDDDLLHNYTVGKATMDCEFILDSPFYNCIEIDDLDNNGDKLRVAFIAATYHCG